MNNSKKILFVLPGLSVGGLEVLQVNLANALCRRGHDITVLILENIRDLEEQLLPQVRLVYKKPNNGWLRKIPYIGNRFYDDGMWEKRTTAKKLHDYYVGKEKFDVEIAFFRGESVKLVSGCEDKTTIKIAWVHSDFRKAVGYKNCFNDMEEVFNAYQVFDKVVCVSSQAEQGFIRAIGQTGNTTVVYNYLPVDKIEELSNEKNPLIKHGFNAVIVARLNDGIKGQIRLISAVKSLNEQGIDICLTIVGDGGDREKIENYIREIEAEKFVHMAGLVKNPYPFIKNADLLVCASYYEGYNLTVAEAMICGTPVLSTECTGPIEILDGGKYGMLVENSEKGLREGLLKFATDEKTLEHYRQMALARKPFFCQDVILDKIEKLWEQN